MYHIHFRAQSSNRWFKVTQLFRHKNSLHFLYIYKSEIGNA